MSETKLEASVIAWAKRGFLLHEPRTWHKAPGGKLPEKKLIWTVPLLALLPEVAEIAHCSVEEARKCIELILGFVEENNELSKSMVGRLLQMCSINGKSGQKQYELRQFLKDQGLLIKVKNYYCDQATGYRHGDFHICGEGVRFEAADSGTHTPLSIYLSLDDEYETEPCLSEAEMLMEGRLLNCEERYRRRIRELLRQIRDAA
jgi:hypothetical protein